MSNKLEVKVTQAPAKIEFNYKEMKQALAEKMEVYNATVVTEDTVRDAKKDLTSLRKVKKALNDRRIEIKKEYDKPYDEFKKKVDELTGLIDKPIEKINEQAKEFEEKQKEEKKKEIQKLYKELIGEVEEYLPLEKIYDNKWENVSKSMKSITEEMTEVISSVEMAVSTIKGMSSEAVPKALEQFKGDLSLANAIAYINKHEQMKAEILAREERKRKEEEERKRRAEEERIREEERKRVAEEERIRKEAKQKAIEEERKRIAEEEKLKAESKLKENPTEVIDDLPDELEESFEEDPLEEPFTEEPFKIEEELPFVTVGEIKTTFTVVGTFEEIEQVEMYLNSIGMSFEREDI